ncbi:OmpH family outer membrane protein [Flavobacteriaceae bacterium]|jgi:Skp family chaperone for outer membrane proteins|nr:OmpH family outer membrane protein [Flavobacteriaceae bacterium]MDA9124437.1 OmpH family outer membrane protein [bacterium]MBT4313075.1 OmpH family outer membrane protein [Flavobacteriaceae bacterium]MBT5090872.1 OmpH family outer membrane protein [Flavobacteriaceae bacterium]MBT5282789.1 OmpH family outer membrane protein [Flavobacteriaceae bacterium]|tara:strand:+ start:8807 stop:9403 length:597 start_codon:yes stop_codon:yes gene_type:complete
MRINLHKTLLINIILLMSVHAHAQRGTRVGYIDMNVILESIDEYQEASQLLDKNVANWKKEIELKKIQLKQFQDQLNTERILLTPELINDRDLEINDFASEIVNLQEKRFGPRGDMIIQRSKLIQPVQDQVMSVVKLIAEEKKYDFIFDRSSNVTMLYSAKNYDISDLVIKRINRQQRIQNKKDQLEVLKSKTSTSNN